jgi:hypothetical protein
MNETKTNLTLKQRQRLQGRVQSPHDESTNSTGKRLAQKVALLLAFLGGVALGMIYFRTDPRLREIEDLQTLMAQAGVPFDLQRELGGELVEALPSDLRSQLWKGRGGRGRSDTRFFTRSPAEQLALLQRIVAHDKEREERRAEAEQAGASNPADSSQSQNNGGGGGKGKSDQQKVQSYEQRLANRPPEMRAQGGLFHQMMNSVRQQQGMPAR